MQLGAPERHNYVKNAPPVLHRRTAAYHAGMSTEIRPFAVAVDDAEIDDLKTRLARTRWPEAEVVDDWTQGIPLAYLREVCEYWASDYDWRRCEAAINSRPNFLTGIDGLDVHFQHIRSAHDDALGMIVTHGWPGSVLEFAQVIDPLVDPTSHGGTEGDAFHLVLPSLPGYGFSAKPSAPGTGVERIAAMWDELMGRLGYDSYVAQGGDWGSAVTTHIGMQDLGRCRAIHTNMPLAGPSKESMADLTAAEQAALESMGYYDKWDAGYSKQQSSRPQTIGYSLVDSPAGLAGWILEKFWSWTDRSAHPEDYYSRDQLLDNVSLYWFTATGASSGRLYWESFGSFAGGECAIPSACSIFPNEVFRASRRWASKRYTDIRYWNEPEAGGHFAAFEQPELFVAEMRAAFKFLDSD